MSRDLHVEAEITAGGRLGIDADDEGFSICYVAADGAEQEEFVGVERNSGGFTGSRRNTDLVAIKLPPLTPDEASWLSGHQDDWVKGECECECERCSGEEESEEDE